MMIVSRNTPKNTPKHAGNHTVWAPGDDAILLKGLADLPHAREPIRPASARTRPAVPMGSVGMSEAARLSVTQGVTADG